MGHPLDVTHGEVLRSVTEALREVTSIQKSNICRGSNILDVFALQINDEETPFV